LPAPAQFIHMRCQDAPIVQLPALRGSTMLHELEKLREAPVSARTPSVPTRSPASAAQATPSGALARMLDPETHQPKPGLEFLHELLKGPGRVQSHASASIQVLSHFQ